MDPQINRNRHIAIAGLVAASTLAAYVVASTEFGFLSFSSNYQSVYPGDLGDALENTVFEQFCQADNSIERDAAITLRDKTIQAHKYSIGAEAWYVHESTSSGDRNCWADVLNQNPRRLDGYQ
jgi:hypothetical protein